MTGETLRTMAKDEEPELRRGAVLAMAMKDEKTHIPDLVAALLDEEEVVVRAAKAGLKSVTGQDFGPGCQRHGRREETRRRRLERLAEQAKELRIGYSVHRLRKSMAPWSPPDIKDRVACREPTHYRPH